MPTSGTHEPRRGRTMMYGVMDVNPGRW